MHQVWFQTSEDNYINLAHATGITFQRDGTATIFQSNLALDGDNLNQSFITVEDPKRVEDLRLLLKALNEHFANSLLRGAVANSKASSGYYYY